LPIDSARRPFGPTSHRLCSRPTACSPLNLRLPSPALTSGEHLVSPLQHKSPQRPLVVRSGQLRVALLRSARGLSASRRCVATLTYVRAKSTPRSPRLVGPSGQHCTAAAPLGVAGLSARLPSLRLSNSFPAPSSTRPFAATARRPFGPTSRRFCSAPPRSLKAARQSLRYHPIHLPPPMHCGPLVVPSVQLRVRVASPGSRPYGLSPRRRNLIPAPSSPQTISPTARRPLRANIASLGSRPFGLSPSLRPPHHQPPTLAHQPLNAAARSTVRACCRESASKSGLIHWL